MAVSWLYLTSVSVNDGDVTVSVSGGHDLSAVESGWSFDLGAVRAEISSGTAADASGNSTLTLAVAWDGADVTNQTAKIVPTSGALIKALNALNETNDYAIATHEAMETIATEDTDVTLTDKTGEEHTFASLPKSARLIEESISENTQKVNELLANKTVDGDDQTEGALLAVGATVKQFNTSNSNMKFEPSVQPTMKLDFAKNEYWIYDTFGTGFVKKDLADIVTHTRSTVATGETPIGVIGEAGVDVPRLVYSEGKAKGYLSEESRTNLLVGTYDMVASESWSFGRTTITEAMDSGIISTESKVTRLTVNSTYNTHVFYQSATYDIGGKYTMSFNVAKPATEGATYVYAMFPESNGFTVSNGICINTETGEVTDTIGTLLDYIVTPHKYGWFVSITATATATTGRSPYIGVSLTGAVNELFTGDGLLGVYVWGLQLEKGAFPTSYIKTETSTVTRAADSMSRTFGNEWNPNEFTFVVTGFDKVTDINGDFFDVRANVNGRLTLSVSTTTNKLSVYYVNGAGAGAGFSTGISVKDKVAMSVNSDSFTVSSNGVSETKSISIFPDFEGGNVLMFGEGVVRNDNYAEFIIYPKALSEAELQELTKL